MYRERMIEAESTPRSDEQGRSQQELVAALREAEERLSLAADSAEAGLWELDYRTGVFWATERARVLFGYAPDEVIDLARVEASVHPDDVGSVRQAIERSRSGEPLKVDYRILTEAGERWLLSRGRPRSTSAGEPDRLMGVTLDISERKRADEALRASEARLAAGADLAGLAFSELDWLSGVMTYADARVRDLLGLPPEVELPADASAVWSGRLHPDDRARVMEMRRRLLGGEADRMSAEYRYVHPDRGERWIQHLAGVAARDADGRATRTYGVWRDITASKRAEEALLDLSQRLIGAHEEERALLARELHDDLSQRLAVLAIEAGRAELSLPEGEGPQTEALRTIREGIVRVSEDIHSLAYQLHPSLLEELGLAEALRAECEHRGRQCEFEITVDVDPASSDVGKDVALCLFRVAQEALGNAARHARASSVTVTLRRVEGGLLLAVADDGAGFDPDTPSAGRHLGLASMRERTRLVNGTLDVESAPGRGTTVVAWAPMTEGPE
jgi:PAS domain S-box-containing protein